MKEREAVQKMIRLLKELNAALSFIKWDLPLSTKPCGLWLCSSFCSFPVLLILLYHTLLTFLIIHLYFPSSHVHSLLSCPLPCFSTLRAELCLHFWELLCEQCFSKGPCALPESWLLETQLTIGLIIHLFVTSCCHLSFKRVRSWLEKGVRSQESGGHGCF